MTCVFLKKWMAAGIAAGLLACGPIAAGAKPAALTPREAFDIATEAYIFGYPLVTMDMTRRVMTNVRQPEGMRAPMGLKVFGPDLDAKSFQYKRWGIIKWIWLPYRMFFSHRSRFSHGLLWGPVTRSIYLARW